MCNCSVRVNYMIIFGYHRTDLMMAPGAGQRISSIVVSKHVVFRLLWLMLKRWIDCASTCICWGSREVWSETVQWLLIKRSERELIRCDVTYPIVCTCRSVGVSCVYFRFKQSVTQRLCICFCACIIACFFF